MQNRQDLWHNPNEEYEYHNKNSRKPRRTLSPRLIGLLFTAGGVVCGYFSLYRKIHQMALGQEIKYSIEMMSLFPMLLSFGLFFILAPKSIAQLVMQPGAKSKWLLIPLALMLTLFILTHYLFKQQAAKYGYIL